MAITAAKLRVEIGAETKDAEAGMKRVDQGLKNLGDVGSGAVKALGAAVVGAGAGLVALGGQALTAYGDFERLGSSLQQMAAKELLNTGQATSMSKALAMSSGTAQELQGWIQRLAIQSPFTSQGVADAFRMAMAYGFTTQQAKRMTQAMIDFSAGSGATEQTMSKISLALGQIRAKGKLAGGEVLQLTEAGIAVDQILAKAFNKSTAEIVAMREQGLIPADEAIEAIVTSLETDFAGAAKNQSSLISGLVSSLSDLKEVGLREFFGPVFKEFQPDLDRFVQTLQDPATIENIRQMGTEFATTMREIVTTGGEVLKWFTSLDGSTQGIVITLGLLAVNAGAASKAITGIYMVGSNLPGLISGISTAWRAWNAGMSLTTALQIGLGPMAVTLGAIALAVAAVVGVWIAWNENITKTNKQGVEGVGSTMSKYLGDLRKDGADAISMTDQFIAAQGRMNDQIKKGGVAGWFVDRNALAKKSLGELSNELIKTGVTYDVYAQQMMRAAQATGTISARDQRFLSRMSEQEQIAWLTQNYPMLTQAKYQEATASAFATANSDDLAQSMRDVDGALVSSSSSFLQQEQAAGLSADQLAEYADKMKAVGDATMSFNQKYANDVVSKMEEAGIKGEQLSQAIGVVDDNMGTNIGTQRELARRMDEMIANYKKTGDIKAFDNALQTNRDEFSKLDEGIREAQSAFDAFMASLQAADGQTFTVKVTTQSGTGDEEEDPRKHCFVFDTPINTPTGYRPLGELRPGDLVLVKTDAGSIEAGSVAGISSHFRDDLVLVRTSDGQDFLCSPDHPWKVRGRGFVQAGRLQPGQWLVALWGEVCVISISPAPGHFEVFDLTVSHPEHTFLVGGLVVHNKEAERLAIGGPALAGRTYMVGEKGPELFHPSSSGTVIPAAETRNLMSEIVSALRSLAEPTAGRGRGLQPIIYISGSNNARQTARELIVELGRMR